MISGSTHSINIVHKAAGNDHVLSLNGSSFKINRPWGNITALTSNEFPILKRLSIQRLVLAPSAVREPHWYVDANKLTYCLCGSALVTIFGNQGEHDIFAISEGQVFFVPSGYRHHIENLNKISTAEFIIAFSHELPEDFSFSSAFSAMHKT